VLDHHLDILEAARFMAMNTVVRADAHIACYDAKYHYAFWRPITAIRAGDTDGNAATVGDPAWSTLLPATPNHPEYPSAHSCVTPAGAQAIAEFMGTNKIDFTVPSLTGLGDRHYDDVDALEREVTNARIWGGIHYRSAVEDGAKVAHKVAHDVLAHNFKKAKGDQSR
jgi:VCPO second helical-bundle domain